MTLKEKSWNMFWNYKNIPDKWKDEKVFQNYYAKECALLAVDEIIDATKGMVDEDNGYSTDSYWQEVKQEIEKL
jgi:ferritin-like protein